ncbi:hypothetical protein P2C66_22020, partial [Xanthomonas perforans]
PRNVVSTSGNSGISASNKRRSHTGKAANGVETLKCNQCDAAGVPSLVYPCLARLIEALLPRHTVN